MNPLESQRETDTIDRDDPDFRLILAELLEAIEQGEPAAADRFARDNPAYAPALLQSALYAKAAGARMLTQSESGADAAVDAGMQAAFSRLGFSPVPRERHPTSSAAAGMAPPSPAIQSLQAARQAVGWSLGDLAQRLSLPNPLVLKLEQGRIVTWSQRLVARIASVLEMSREQAESVLRASIGSHGAGAVTFAATGDPEVSIVRKNRRETLDFEEALANERLTPEQAAAWREGP